MVNLVQNILSELTGSMRSLRIEIITAQVIKHIKDDRLHAEPEDRNVSIIRQQVYVTRQAPCGA